VTIFEKTSELGGAILYCCVVPGKAKMRWYADWLRRQVKNLGVDVHFHCRASADELKEFDAVILATGGKLERPDIPGIDSSLVCTFQDVLRCGLERCEFYAAGEEPPVGCGERVLIWGDHFGASDAAERLASDGKTVYVVTKNREFAQWMEPCHRDVMMKRFAGGTGEGLKGKRFTQPVTVISNTTVAEIKDNGEVTLMDHRFQKSTLAVDNVVLASIRPDNNLYEGLIEAGIRAIRIGDCKRVRNLLAAVHTDECLKLGQYPPELNDLPNYCWGMKAADALPSAAEIMQMEADLRAEEAKRCGSP